LKYIITPVLALLLFAAAMFLLSFGQAQLSEASTTGPFVGLVIIGLTIGGALFGVVKLAQYAAKQFNITG
jgi:hypothetical protein